MRALSLSVLLLALAGPLAAQEICNNGIDDDGDGQVDLNDPDCGCFGSLNSGVISLVPNHSFEERMCCPGGFVSIVGPPWLSCATGWRPGTQGTTDYFHSCGYMPEPMTVQPAPDGEGFVGVYPGIAQDNAPYFEYIYRGGAGFEPLQPGVSYTMEVWFAPTSSDGTHEESVGNFYGGAVRMALIGDLEGAVAPIETLGCLGSQPGWIELAVADLLPSTTWQRVRFDFTPQQEIRGIALGGSCEQSFPSPEFVETIIIDGDTTEETYAPFVLIDDLVLNTSDQFQLGITVNGAWCMNDLLLNATLTNGATGGQWYLNGVALVGETSSLLDLSGAARDGGLYTFAQQGAEECIRHDHYVPIRPAFTFTPDTGMAPLEVTFITTTPGNGPSHWDLGDGTQAVGDTVVHVYWNADDFTVSLQQEVDGCALTTVADHAVVVQQIEIAAEPQPTDVNETHITLTGNGPEGITSWVWDLGAVPPFLMEGQQVEVDFPPVAGVYEVMLVVSGEFRELDSDTAHYEVVILPATGIDGPTGGGTITVKPNPVEDVVTVQVTMPVQRWWVVNALGEEVLRGTAGTRTVQFGTTSLGPGTYVLMMQGADAPAAVRFIKR